MKSSCLLESITILRLVLPMSGMSDGIMITFLVLPLQYSMAYFNALFKFELSFSFKTLKFKLLA